MYFKKIETESLAHFSYMIGDEDDIAVIDPMRDVQVYMHEARKEGMRIKYIFETHRNEDFITGSMELAEKTGSTIYISGHEDLGHVYGERIRDGFQKKEETRKNHVERIISELKEGMHRPCCWLGCIHRTDKSVSPSVKGILNKRSK